jgi:ribonuclease/clavin/mitogillin
MQPNEPIHPIFPTTPKAVTPHVHQIPVSTPTLFPATTTNVYLIEHSGEAVLIDAGYDHEDTHQTILRYVQSIGSPSLKAILITHFHKDHSPGARFLAAHFGCPILAHEADVPHIEELISPARVTRTLGDGDTLQVGALTLHVLHAPGHTYGCLNFWLPEDNILFTADNIVGIGTTWIGPPEGDLRLYLQTLDRLKTLPAALIAPGHGDMIEDVEERINFFITRRLERETQILTLLAARPRTAEELLVAIYQNTVPESVLWVAERTILGHLNKLLSENKIRLLPQNKFGTHP